MPQAEPSSGRFSQSFLEERARAEEGWVFGSSRFKENSIVLDAQKLSKRVVEMANGAVEVGVNLGDLETVWIAKFTSIVSHETIHKVITELENEEASRRFDRLYFAHFMEKLPAHSIHVQLWSDALETCPIGDTWFS